MIDSSHDHRHEMTYGKKVIEFNLIYSNRKTLEIAVHPDQTVVVTAPAQSDMSLIEKKVMKRVRWILRQLNYFKQFNPRTPERCYVNGETHLYLGRQYRLKVVKGATNSVKLSRGFFNIECKNTPEAEDIKIILNKWYSEKAKSKFHECLARCWPRFNRFGFIIPELKIKRMTKRWGSLSSDGILMLNTELIRAPKECIEYVVMHELCHLKYHDHSSDFYKLLESTTPGWEKIKQKLELSLI